MATTTQAQATAVLPTAPAPTSVSGYYQCTAKNTVVASSVNAPVWPAGTIPNNQTYTAITFLPVGTSCYPPAVFQGGNLAYMSNGSGTSSQLGGNNAVTDYWFQDQSGNLVYMTTIPAVVSAYTVSSFYTLNLSPSY